MQPVCEKKTWGLSVGFRPQEGRKWLRINFEKINFPYQYTDIGTPYANFFYKCGRYPFLTEEGVVMMNLKQLKKRTDILNEIDWEMTPEEAVRLYLEWGTNWVRSHYVIRSVSDVSYYFTVYAWEDPPVIFLVRRNSAEAVELARIAIPADLKAHFLKTTGQNKGVYALEGEIRDWLKSQLGHA